MTFILQERNAASLLFSSLVTRVFGVKRGRDEFSLRNLMAARHFFQRYPSMHATLLEELREGAAAIVSKESSAALHPRETALFPSLVVLAKLKPSPACTGQDKWKVRNSCHFSYDLLESLKLKSYAMCTFALST